MQRIAEFFLPSVFPKPIRAWRVGAVLFNAIFLPAVFLLGFSSAEAKTVTSTTSGLWSNPASWSTNAVPSDSDDVVIAGGTSITVDKNSARLKTLQLDGTLHGGRYTIKILIQFVGSGSFQPDSGTVAFVGTQPVILSQQTVPNYYNLWLADSTDSLATRTLFRSLIVQHDFRCDLRRTAGAKIDGTGSLTVGGSFVYIGDSTSWSGQIILDDQTGAKLVRLRIAPPRGPLFRGPFTFPRVTIAKPDTTYVVKFGFADSNHFSNPAIDSLIGDTLYVGTGSGLVDTAITIIGGTLDAYRGLISCAGSPRSAASGPFVHLASGARYRTARVIIAGSAAPFDSLTSPIFACDGGSVFEYYATTNIHYLQDISYIANSLASHSYADLWIAANAVVGFTYNPVRVKGSLYLQNNGLINPAVTSGPMRSQEITILGNVLNENRGPSNSQGAGPDGDGMTAGNENWIFNAPNDTSTWTGPSELSKLTVGPTTTLSVRFQDDRHCDSLFYADSLDEQFAPCGGHVLGRVFTGPRLLDANNPSTNFGGIGLTISTGTVPILGRTRVVRTSGYLPPGVFYGNRVSHTIKRYFKVIPEFGPQAGIPDTLGFAVHCSEFNGSDISSLHFWRSTDGGNAWAIRGISGRSKAPNTFLLDTNAIGYPNGENNFLWALTDQEADVPLSVGLESFTAGETKNGVSLNWRTYAESNALGFEVSRVMVSDSTSITSTIASWESADSLGSRSRYGANYHYLDQSVISRSAPSGSALSGILRYRLSERTKDGVLLKLAEVTLTSTPEVTPLKIRVLENPLIGSRLIPIELSGGIGNTKLMVFDVTGKLVTETGINRSIFDEKLEIGLPTGITGTFLLIATCQGSSTTTRLVVF